MKLAISNVMNTHNTALYSELHKKLVAALKEQNPNSVSGASANLPDVAVAAASGGGASAGSNPSNNEAIKDQLASPAMPVREWIDVRNKKAALKLEKLDTDLKNYKSNSIKVSHVCTYLTPE